jgi:dephospho-CoA kinase
LAIDADQRLRYERAMTRGNESDHVSFEKFQEQEQAEMTTMDVNKQNISACMAMADIVVSNDGTVEELYEQLNQIFG